MTENIFEGVEQEGEPIELDTPEQTGSEAPIEKKQEVKPQEGKPEGETPELPDKKENWRWMRMRKANREYKEQLESLKAEIESIKSSKEQQSKGADLPADWVSQYGDSPESRKAYQTYLKNTEDVAKQIEDRLYQKIKSEQQSETKGTQEAKEFIDTELQDMQDEGLLPSEMVEIDGKKQNPAINKLMNFVLSFQKEYGNRALLDDKDNYDLRKALKLMQKLQPEPQENNETRKKVASDTMRTKGTPKTSDIPTVSKGALRRGTWRDAVE